MNYSCKIIRYESKVKTEEGSKNYEVGQFAKKKKRQFKNRQSQLLFTDNQNHKKAYR